MTDLRNVAIIGMMGRLNMLIDEGVTAPTPADVKSLVADGTILDRLCSLYGKFPEFAPIHKAEGALLRKELKAVADKYAGEEESRMGVEKNGLCLLMGYCLDMLMERSLHELRR